MSVKREKELKICLIGNSHSGCIRTGWDAIKDYYPTVDIKSYPHSGEYYDLFRVHAPEKYLSIDDAFVQNQFEMLSGNEGNIAFYSFDLCLVVGGIYSREFLQNGYSNQVYEAMISDYISDSHVRILLEKIRQISDIPITILSTPYGGRRDKVAAVSLEKLVADNRKMDAILAEKYDARLLVQPIETLITPTLSKLEYVVGERLTGASLVPGAKQEIIEDLVHMNAAYGALFLSQILADHGFKPEALQLPKPDGHLPFAERNMKQ